MADKREDAIRARLTASTRRHHADVERAVDALLEVVRAAEAGEPATLIVEATPNGRLFAKPLQPRRE